MNSRIINRYNIIAGCYQSGQTIKIIKLVNLRCFSDQNTKVAPQRHRVPISLAVLQGHKRHVMAGQSLHNLGQRDAVSGNQSRLAAPALASAEQILAGVTQWALFQPRCPICIGF